VEPDARPLVRIQSPAQDLIFDEPKGQVPIAIEARDDIALTSLGLRFTRMAGSGETFTFEEGELPLRIDRTADKAWNGRALLALEGLKLEDGDTIVYRAIATDAKPGADPSTSETFLIEIGRLAGVASTGFALPAERDRQGLSQQMLIMKTERLHVDRTKLSAEEVAERARMLGVEQRMIRAEFVFMTGGEVADEVEEATQAHELAEGRLENQGQVELLAAIREMSRAEAELNASDLTDALVHERAALRALQRAFDRRRYLLRPAPERARIDLARRLSGALNEARSSTQPAHKTQADERVATVRELMHELASEGGLPSASGAVIAARLLALDPESAPLQKVVAALSTERDGEARAVTGRNAQRLLADMLKARLARGVEGRVPVDPLEGRVADAATRAGIRR